MNGSQKLKLTAATRRIERALIRPFIFIRSLVRNKILNPKITFCFLAKKQNVKNGFFGITFERLNKTFLTKAQTDRCDETDRMSSYTTIYLYSSFILLYDHLFYSKVGKSSFFEIKFGFQIFSIYKTPWPVCDGTIISACVFLSSLCKTMISGGWGLWASASIKTK